MNKLPTEIINHILSYTYQFQPNNLLEDIKNFHETKKEIIKIYYNKWIIQYKFPEPEHKNWLINNLYRYANVYQAAYLGYTDHFYNIWFRNIRLKTKKQVNIYFEKIQQKNVNTEINIIWGLFTSQERNYIIKLEKKEDMY